MKTEGRPKSRNIVDRRDTTFDGRRNNFINESLKLGADNHRPKAKLGKTGSRKSNTGYKTGGGF